MKKDNRGNESGYWNQYYPSSNPPSNNKDLVGVAAYSQKEIIDEPKMQAAKDNEKPKTYISLKKSEI